MRAVGPEPEDRICIEGLTFLGCHGVHPEEQEQQQRFEVDLELHRSLTQAAASDRLVDTLDYCEIAQLVVEVGRSQRCRLIERLAQVIAETVLARHPGVQVVVTVRKFPPGLPGNPRSVAVTLVRGGLTG